jgi:hypothetical protein
MPQLVAHQCCRLLVSYKIGGILFHSTFVLFGYLSSGSISLMLDTQADAPPSSLRHVSKQLWIVGAKGVFHTSAQPFVGGVAANTHSSPVTTAQVLVQDDKVKNTWQPLMVTVTSVNQANSESSRMFVHNVLRTERAKCACAPSYESPISESRFEPRLQHCRIRCQVHGFIEKVRFNQII